MSEYEYDEHSEYYGRNDRKTDDVDPEWLSRYLKRHHKGNEKVSLFIKKYDSASPREAAFRLSPPDWIKLRSAWRQHQYRESKKNDIEAWRESVIQFKEWCAEMGADPAGALLAAMDILDDDPVRIGQMIEEIRQRKEAAESKRKKSAAAKKRYQKKKAAAAAETKTE
jgi:hypothetical protein